MTAGDRERFRLRGSCRSDIYLKLKRLPKYRLSGSIRCFSYTLWRTIRIEQPGHPVIIVSKACMIKAESILEYPELNVEQDFSCWYFSFCCLFLIQQQGRIPLGKTPISFI